MSSTPPAGPSLNTAHVLCRSLLQRLRARLRVGSAYDMAREIAPHLPNGARVLDVGCGSGFILLHLRGLLGVAVHGVDIVPTCAAPVPYTRFDGQQLPFPDRSFDAVLLCYVLHHAGDPAGLLCEARRVLAPGGKLILYEDIPTRWYDRLLCLKHELSWLGRAGACTFMTDRAWRGLLTAAGFELQGVHRLSRGRDLTYPIGRHFYSARRLPEAG
jgi:SAM-dependent methyltransferase